MSQHDEAARRAFLRRALALATATLLAPASYRVAAKDVVIDVRTKGARGNGNDDDTSAIQAAIDALPSSGGTVHVPAGNYMVDASHAINLRSNVRLDMAPDARLTALPNALKRYHIIKVWDADNVQITGGRIVGERDLHQDVQGEWGYGINITGSHNVTVTGTHISGCWGDGVLISAKGKGANMEMASDITLQDVVCTNNRRQGMSLGPCQRVRILNCTFSDTQGTKPQSGIDLEPMGQGQVSDVLIQGCTMTGNKGCGVEIHRNVSGLVIRQCTIQDNSSYGILAVDMDNLWVDGNTIASNGMNGITLGGHTSDVKITGNTLSSNSTRYLHRALKSLVSGPRGGGGSHKLDLRIDDSTSNVHVSGNTFNS
ncbi:MAG: right-handed parallel beta-helix repeat-containing protein [Frateuria sp.]|uniref:right-handed parallel beta-helix repeat-containing protein n=1 Tax=Frateuria sp. TaxID=2211372 RepID=UPI00180F8FCB|nr:right-handed parallel beta-helix repeat-containing protein [Frateuria sp.]NUO71163.1 right-handed parallel beta-helix repeat-containing protein [Frateuria sp.]NUR23000.1 right-handed parallel beta-helix repeat-containing protein [Frateuria sp.]